MFTVQATDSGLPGLSGTQSFLVTVLRPAQPALSNAGISNGIFGLTINGDLGPDYSVYGSTNLLDWSLLNTTNPPTVPFFFSDPAMTNYNLRFYRVLLGP